ncbi:cyanoexosortase B system-associated protein [Aetokthonos hydrillicola Thurmond2011]|jgi:cyanoexosortase B-associated protein|uniref:Cyanoexosortase B system-associated protein n=1 Tax=Aetokthonos hydrillicola Thurmond2011 TaxID=2712845 RepID=A0AAP5IFB9_9CYAN|nr:cyanoexosortase B system-associated protein [Aetokthonos hydrillicola]MBO3462364.1 cyanoexosortase B system-associated protein [Aetokthonos hydrillicola CCALA 1050]MBW4584219.1 cyanoexosortase B system-associated protein [Aetokthonos hydrillicola CCALA 1050]MDR9898573.1 cyanoexosortase B system-associated protein [Aetokthonos hydrillicola Thurmond2011]
MIPFPKFFKEYQFPQVIVLLLLLLLLVMGALPGYLSGHWQWQEPPRIINLKKLKQIRANGLSLPGWQNVAQREEMIGGHKWSYQIIEKQVPKTQAIVLLLPQNGPKDQPQVEWTEINSWGQWNVAQERLAEFHVKASKSNTETPIKARFFRASTKQQTFAVLQWYAWPNGGNPSPLPWFLADQLAQWRQQRASWVAVSILIPMEPFGKVETSWQQAESLGKSVHTTLEENFL